MFSFLKNAPNKPIITHEDMTRIYQRRPSIIDRLPWCDYNEKHKCFLLEDNESLGVCFKITPIPCEARPEAMLEEISKTIADAIKNSIPCEKENPWILQVYIKKEPSLSSAYQDVLDYFPEERKKTPLTKAYLDNIGEHFKFMDQSGGIFHDNQVTNTTFRGGVVQVNAVLYRRIVLNKSKQVARRTHLEEIIRVSRKFSEQLRAAGIRIKRMSGKDFCDWMRPWFNPTKSRMSCYPDENQKPQGFDLAEQLFASTPESFIDGWYFDGLPHKVITIQSMTMNPAIGHISAERRRNLDDKVFNLIDHLPEESIFVITVTCQAPSESALHLNTVSHSAVGNHAQAIKVKSEIIAAEKAMADGDRLFPVVMNVYLKAETLNELYTKESEAEVLLNGNGFKVITDDELFPIDAYLRYLPMCYDFHFDKQSAYRSRYILLSDIAKILPFYGRSRGTGHPGFIGFNRGGETWFYDLIRDRTKNAHLLLLGENGTGKSNLMNLLIMQSLALYNSRFFIFDFGGSYSLLGELCCELGLSVNHLKISMENPASLNPFANALRLIKQIEVIQAHHRDHYLFEAVDKLEKEQNDNKHSTISDTDEGEEQDVLGDMVIAALLMITGGEKKEEESIRRGDRILIMDAIIDAAYFIRDKGCDEMVAGDVVDGFERIAKKFDVTREAEKISRCYSLADAMRVFTRDPVSSLFFNNVGNAWKLADVTIVDLGMFAKEGYEAQRALAVAGCINKIQMLAEANQRSNRSINVVFDENHILSSVPLLADMQTRLIKTSRKLGLWLWFATQNMKDFSDRSHRMLSQIETWICLALTLDEIEQVERFKTLTAEERALLLSAQKAPRQYTEGVLLSPKMKGLFRNIPPRLYLALAATEQSEKNLRFRVMAEHKCTELDAARMIAREMMTIKKEVHQDD
jgi:conjugative transfer ATPase